MADLGDIQIGIKAEFTQLSGLLKTTEQTTRAVKALARDFARTGDNKQYLSSINKIVRANHALGDGVGMSQAAIMKLGGQIKRDTIFTDKLTLATKKLALAQVASGKAVGNTRNKMNGTNMAIQQAGYQFGDFAVQVQGGTSAFVAFSQQGAQLAGILPMIAGPLGLSMGAAVGLSAALGILIPIGSAIGRMFFEMSGKSKTASEKITDLTSALKLYQDIAKLGVASTEELREQFGQFGDIVQSLSDTLEGVALRKLVLAIDTDPFTGEVSKVVDKINGLQDEMDKIKYPKIPDSVQGNNASERPINKIAIDSAKLAVKIANAEVGTLFSQIDLASKKLGLLPDQLVNIGEALKGIGSTDDSIGAIGTATANAFEVVGKVINELKDSGSEIPTSLDKLFVKLKDATGEVGKSADVTAQHFARMQGKRDKAILEGIAIFRAANKKAAAEKEELEKRAFARRFADEESLMGMSLKVDKATQKKIDDAVTLNQKQGDFLAKQKVQLSAANMISEKTGGELFAAQQINEMVLFKLELDRLELKSGDEKYNQLVAYKELMQEAEARTFYRIQLEKEAVEAKRISDAEAKRANDILLDQYAKIEDELQKQADAQKQFADDIANSFGTAFTSMVDGTKSVKDAFKDMARDIIKQLYQILVVEQMVASISGGIQSAMGGAPMQGPMPSGNVIGSANGNVISSGSKIQAYANGGVVSSPTNFPMSGNKMGLMGEAGPEAIMPLKRGSNGKLGVQMEGNSGGVVTNVVQNFNFSANGDDSVKKLIAQAAPKIAQMTKSEIINDRRRGGKMKATFG